MMHPIPDQDLVTPDNDACDILQELQERLDAARIVPKRIVINLPPNLPANVLVEVTDPADMRAWAEHDGASVWVGSNHVVTVLPEITWFCVLIRTPPTTQEH